MSVWKWNVEASVDIWSVKKATSELKSELQNAWESIEKNFWKKWKETIWSLENKIRNLKNALKDIEIWTQSFKKISEEVKRLEWELDKAQGKVWWFSGMLSKIGWFLGFTTLAYGVWNFMVNVAKAGSQLESAQLSFETLLWSAEKAKEHLAYIDQIAQQSPFSKMWVIELNQQLLWFWFTADQTLTATQVLWDAISAVWWTTEDLQGVATALWQIQAKWKISTEEIMQMTERNVNVLPILKEELWLTEEQIWNLWNAWIDAATWINAILTWLNKKFNWAMQKQSQTLAWMWANMTDNAGIILWEIWLRVQSSFKEVIWWIADFLEKNKSTIMDFGADMISFIWNTWKSFFEAITSIITNILSVFWVATNDTAAKWNALMKVFKIVFLTLSMWFQTVALIVSAVVSWIFGWLKAIWSWLWVAIARALAHVKLALKNFANMAIWPINWVINWINKLRRLLWKEALPLLQEFKTEAENLLIEHWQSVTDVMWEAWNNSFEWTKNILNNMIWTLENFNTDVEYSWNNAWNVWDKINKTLESMSWNYWKMWKAAADAWDKAGGGSKKAAKESEEQKKKVEELEKKYDKVKEEVKELEKATEDYAKNHKKYYDEIVKDVEKLQKELKKAKAELDKELLGVEEDKNKDIADRYVDIKERELEIEEEIQEIKDKAEMSDDKRAEELGKINKQIEIQKQRISEINDKTKESTKNSLKNKLEELETQKKKLEDWEMSLEQAKKLAELEKEALEIAKEREIIEKNVSWEKLADAERFSKLSKTEQILETSENKKKKAEEEYEIEKKKIENMIKINEFFYKADTFNQKMYDEIQKSEFFKKLSDEEKELLNKLAKEKLALEAQKTTILQMQADISNKIRELNEETTEKQLQNNEKIKKSYDNIISQIDKAIQRQIRLNSLKWWKWYKEWWYTGFSSWWFTWWTDKDKVAWVVHEWEWVAPKWMVEKLSPLFQNLEAQRLSGTTTNITKNQTNNITVGWTFEAKDFLDYAKWKM